MENQKLIIMPEELIETYPFIRNGVFLVAHIETVSLREYIEFKKNDVKLSNCFYPFEFDNCHTKARFHVLDTKDRFFALKSLTQAISEFGLDAPFFCFEMFLNRKICSDPLQDLECNEILPSFLLTEIFLLDTSYISYYFERFNQNCKMESGEFDTEKLHYFLMATLYAISFALYELKNNEDLIQALIRIAEWDTDFFFDYVLNHSVSDELEKIIKHRPEFSKYPQQVREVRKMRGRLVD